MIWSADAYPKAFNMITRFLKGLHVPDDVVKDYDVSSKFPEGLCHNYVVGVSEPTEASSRLCTCDQCIYNHYM